MSEQKLYEIALRAVGLFLVPVVAGYLGLAIQSTIVSASSSYQAVTTGILFLTSLAACTVLIAFAPRLARVFSREDLPAADFVPWDFSTIMSAGISLIGVYTITRGLPELVLAIVRAIGANRGSSFSGGGILVLPAVRIAVGLTLAFHAKLLSWLRQRGRAIRQFHDETRDSD